MSLLYKIILFFLIILGLLIGGAVYLQSQVTPQRVREYLVPLLQNSLERQVELGEVEVGLFTGITVYDLVVKQQQERDADFLSVKRVDLYYELWPLLTGQFIVNQVALEQPVIAISRFKDGSYNFKDLSRNGQPVRSTYREKSVAVANELLSVLVRKVTIQNGTLMFVDAKDNPKTPYRYKFSHLNLNVRDFTFEDVFPFDASLRFNDAQLDISGHYNFALNSGDLIVNLSALDLVPLAPYYRNYLPGKFGAGKVALNIEADIQPDQFSSKGKISFDGLDIRLTSFNGVAFKKADLATDYSIIFDRRTLQVSIPALLLKLNKIAATVDGSIDLSGQSPDLDVSLWLNKFDLREVRNSVPDSLIHDFQKYSLAGIVDGRITLQGPVSQPESLFRSARLSLNDVQISTEQLRLGLAGDISYLNDNFKTSDFSLSYGNQSLNLTVDARKSRDGIFSGTFSLTADAFDCNEVLGASRVSDSSGNLSPESEGADIGSFDLPLDLTGTLSANSIKYRNLVLEHAFADAQIHNNRLRLQNIKMNLGNGRVKGESNLNLGVPGLAYSGDVQLNDIDLLALYAGLYPNGTYTPSGTMRLDTTFSGYGTRKDRLLKALNMQGSFRVEDGSVLGFPVLDSVAAFVGGEDLRRVTFRSLRGQYQFANNILRQNSQLEGTRLSVGSQGNVDLAGYTNLKLDTRISPQVLRRSGTVADALAALTDEQGWGMIPLQVSGYLERLKVDPDADVIQRMLAEHAKQKVLTKLSEKVEGTDAVQDGVQEMLDNTLNKLFGK